jgi:hypothetical protein
MLKYLITIFFLTCTSCSITRPPQGGLTPSEVIVATAAVRSGADFGCDQVKKVDDAILVAAALGGVRGLLTDGDLGNAVQLLQHEITISQGEARAALNAMMALRALIPLLAVDEQVVAILTAGVDECVLLLETKFPEIAPSAAERALDAVGL